MGYGRFYVVAIVPKDLINRLCRRRRKHCCDSQACCSGHEANDRTSGNDHRHDSELAHFWHERSIVHGDLHRPRRVEQRCLFPPSPELVVADLDGKERAWCPLADP
jgi:hypothetical protein